MPRSLQDDLKQGKPFVSLEHEAVPSIARSAARPEHQAAEMLKGSPPIG